MPLPIRPMKALSPTAALALAVTALALVLCAGAARAAPSARALSASQIPASSAWKRYVIRPGRLVYPKRVRVVGAAGAVSNPNGLKAVGGGVTTISATGAGVPRLVLDLGVNTGGKVDVGITRSDGTRVLLGYSELRRFLTPRGDTCGCGGLGLSIGADDDPEGRTDVIASSGPVAFTSPGIRGAERYIALQLESVGAVSIDYVRVRPTHLRVPARGYAGHFYASDRTLNRVWYMSAYTFALDSIRDLRPAFRRSSKTVVVDGAKRDRLIWAGDAVIENLLGQYSLRAGAQIMRRSLQAFSCLQYGDGQLRPATPIATSCPKNPPPAGEPFPPSAGAGPGIAAIRLPEYTASWIIGVHDYFTYTGDSGFARRMLPVVRRGLDYFRRNTRGGLFVTPSRALTLNWHPFDTATGVDAHTNATLYRALRAGADLERWVGRGRRAARIYGRRAAAIKRAMLARLWDRAAGAFLVNPGDARRNHTQDAQVEAVLGGVTSHSQSRSALRFINWRLLRRFGVANGQFDDDPYMSNYISPFLSSTELLARLGQGDANGALRLVRRTWGHMLSDGPGTLWEKMAFSGLPANYAALQAPRDPFGPDGAGSASLAHGWSGGPVPALSGYVLGIRPSSPGYRRWIVAPQPGNLRFAQGQARTPRGPLVSRWRRGRRNASFRLTVVAPRRTSGVVEVPLLGARRKIWMDGCLAWDGRRASGGIRAGRVRGAVRFRGVRGRHTFAWGRSG
jgi:alpha-L-rhamnosidase